LLNEALKNLETALKRLTDINDALDETLIVAITDQRGIITFANKKFCNISKYTREELIGQTHRLINSGYHSKKFFKEMWKTIGNGKVWRGDIRNKAKDGSFYWVDTTIVPCLNEGGKPYQYISFRIDITERKQTEEFLRRSERVAAVGQLASGIAHEIRNPLAAIKMSIHSIQQHHEKDKQLLSLMLSELERIDSIVSEFLLLAKPHEIQFQEQDICQLMNMIIPLMNIQAIRHNVSVLQEFADDIPLIRCDPNQLKQVFMNLIKNAIEAMPNGGNLHVQIRRPSSEHVLIRFVDQGCGIPEEVIKRIGEPFFTTKEKGTGLGLMISHKIIEDHGGSMNIMSEVNHGTIVEISLPV